MSRPAFAETSFKLPETVARLVYDRPPPSATLRLITGPTPEEQERIRADVLWADSVIQRIDLSRFGIPISLHAEGPDGAGYQALVIVTAEVKDRDSGEPRQITTRVLVPGRAVDFTFDGAVGGPSEQTLIEAVRRAIRQLVFHEVDECLLVDGRRAFDPHATTGAT
jgi:hypothetical protein